MGIYDQTSTTQFNAVILKNEIDVSGLSKGYGLMEVKLSNIKRGHAIFEKVYTANTQFESSFSGTVAVPKGQSEYPSLVRALLQKVYSDTDFIEAVK